MPSNQGFHPIRRSRFRFPTEIAEIGSVFGIIGITLSNCSNSTGPEPLPNLNGKHIGQRSTVTSVSVTPETSRGIDFDSGLLTRRREHRLTQRGEKISAFLFLWRAGKPQAFSKSCSRGILNKITVRTGVVCANPAQNSFRRTSALYIYKHLRTSTIYI